MATLYLMRHGQTVYNLEGRVQGWCDSPLTPLGRAQARVAGAWFAEHGIALDHAYTSPAGRAMATATEVLAAVEETASDLLGPDARTAKPVDALKEHGFGSFEGGPNDELPTDPWEPGDVVVPFGGESQGETEQRVARALSEIMALPGHEHVLAVSHGSASNAFRRHWEGTAQCPQQRTLTNCCILVFEYDPATGRFSNTHRIDHDFSHIEVPA